MKWLVCTGVAGLLLVALGGCPGSDVRNPYLTYIEEYVGSTGGATGDTGSGSAGSSAAGTFRDDVSLTFRNNHADAILDTSFVAWVNVNSLRSAEQQEALLAGGYVQLVSELQLGSVFTLPVGTFVYGGSGFAGATPVRLGAGASDGTDNQAATTPTSVVFNIITPDAILIFSQPPVSCDGVAFSYLDTQTGEVLPGISTQSGGYKTYAQVNVYECDPFRPGLFFNQVGGQFKPNEYDEGTAITIDFNAGPAANGAFAIVAINNP